MDAGIDEIASLKRPIPTCVTAMSKAKRSLLWTAKACLAGWFLLAAHAQAADARVTAAQKAFNTAQIKLNQARQAFDKTQQEFAKAQSAHQTTSNKLHQARQAAAQKHGADLGMSEAVLERDTAFHQITGRRTALEAQLKTERDYQVAENETEAARKRLEELPEDKSLTPDQQEKLGSELAAKIRRPTELRKKAETGDGEIQQAAERYQTAGKKIAALQPQLKKAIDSDPAVTKAAEQEKQAAAALEKARKAAASKDQELLTAQGNLDRHGQDLQAAIAQSRRVRHR
jgi:chromosome segregation ATPase